MITALMLIALSGAPPTVDAAKVCRDAQASALPEDAKVAFDACVRDEQAAHDKLAARWPHYSASARSACVGDGTLRKLNRILCARRGHAQKFSCVLFSRPKTIASRASDRDARGGNLRHASASNPIASAGRCFARRDRATGWHPHRRRKRP